MPWTLELHGLAVDFIVALILGAGWTLGCWLMAKLCNAIFRPAPPK